MKTSRRVSFAGLGLLLSASSFAYPACSSGKQSTHADAGDGDDISTGDGDITGDGDTGDGDAETCYSLFLHRRPAGEEGDFAAVASGIALMDPAVVLTDEGLGLIPSLRQGPSGYIVEGAELVPESDLEASAVRIFDSGEVLHLDLDGDGTLDSLTRVPSESLSAPAQLIVSSEDSGMGAGPTTPPSSAEYDLERVHVAQAGVGDINEDGYLDYVYSSEGGVDVLFGQQDGTFSGRQNVTSGDYLEHDLVVGDVDADGVDEIVTVTEHRMTVWESADGLTFSNRLELLNVFARSIGFAPEGHPAGPALIVVSDGPAVGTYPECELECETADECDFTDFCSFGACVECRGHADCDGSYCGRGICHECLVDAHCDSDGDVCVSGACESAISELDGYTQVELGQVLCALRDGALTCRGDLGSGYELQEPGPYTKVSVSQSEEGVVCALRADGMIDCFPGPMDPPSSLLDEIPSGAHIDVAVGMFHACALDAEGEISCWGESDSGQLDAPSGSFTSVALGDRHSCAVSVAGEIECWGCASDSCDDGQATPPGGSDFSLVVASLYQSCALHDDGTASCWGDSNGFSAALETWSSLDCSGWHCCGNDRETQAVRCSGGDADWAPSELLHSLSTYSDFACGLRGDGIIQCSYPLLVEF